MSGPSVRPASWEFRDGLHGGLRGPDPHDPRDLLVSANTRRLGIKAARPERWHLFDKFPPIRDQGNVGQCVGATYRTAREYLSLKIGHALQPLSSIWLYYVARARFWASENMADTGLYMRDGVRIMAGSDLTKLHGRGIAPESSWTNDPAQFNVAPDSESYGTARFYANILGFRVESLGELMDVIAAGWAVALGFTLRNSFWQAKGFGRVPMPTGFIDGGHAVCAGGYAADPSYEGGGYIEARNSWGLWTKKTGDNLETDGNIRFPWDFFLTSDTFPDAWAIVLSMEAIPPEILQLEAA